MINIKRTRICSQCQTSRQYIFVLYHMIVVRNDAFNAMLILVRVNTKAYMFNTKHKPWIISIISICITYQWIIITNYPVSDNKYSENA